MTSSEARPLATTARKAILYGGGFTLVRDVAQFLVMIAMVRLLRPEDYGVVSLSQAIIGVLSMFSFATFSSHALQLRDPENVDWQLHFTAAAIINVALFIVTSLIAIALYWWEPHKGLAMPLFVMGAVFLIEIPATFWFRILSARHNWERSYLLSSIGSLIGLIAGIIIAVCGGGYWALAVQPLLFGVPAALDLLLVQRFKADWRWSWSGYRDTLRFGFDRIGSGFVGRGRVLNEQVLLSSLYDLATLGIFTRATGLAMLVAGRIGSVVMLSLHPVLTRAERGSARFRRLADFVLRGVVWTTVPASACLGLAASDMVAILYGGRWSGVAGLMPFAAVAIGLGGIIASLSSLLVANENARAALWLDATAAASAIALAFLLIPRGASTYLAGLGIHGLMVAGAAIVLLVHYGALSTRGAVVALAPALVACTAGTAAVFAVREAVGTSEHLVVRLTVDASTLALSYMAALRLAFAQPLVELLEVAPGGPTLARALGLTCAGN